MPYDPDNPPEKVSSLSEKKQRQWVHVYNSARERGADEESAHKQAWGAVNKEMKMDAKTTLKKAKPGTHVSTSKGLFKKISKGYWKLVKSAPKKGEVNK